MAADDYPLHDAAGASFGRFRRIFNRFGRRGKRCKGAGLCVEAVPTLHAANLVPKNVWSFKVTDDPFTVVTLLHSSSPPESAAMRGR